MLSAAIDQMTNAKKVADSAVGDELDGHTDDNPGQQDFHDAFGQRGVDADGLGFGDLAADKQDRQRY